VFCESISDICLQSERSAFDGDGLGIADEGYMYVGVVQQHSYLDPPRAAWSVRDIGKYIKGGRMKGNLYHSGLLA